MLSNDIIKKIKYIEIKTKNLVNDMFGGEYHSAFKGSGMEFDEVREYIPGDDIRSIDWNVTARYGKPYIKKYNEEREQTVMLAIDISASVYFGFGEKLKYDMIIEIASILCLSAIRNNDKVGVLLFTDNIEKFIPPSKGKTHVLRIIRELLYFRPKNKKTNIKLSLEYLIKILKRKSVLFIISDFMCYDFEKALKIANQKHDLITIKINDYYENTLNNLGLIKLKDNENNRELWVDSSNNIENKLYNNSNKQLKLICEKNNIDIIRLSNQESYIEPLINFFKQRSSKK